MNELTSNMTAPQSERIPRLVENSGATKRERIGGSVVTRRTAGRLAAADCLSWWHD
jgi:hypothetical protein